MVMRYQRKFGFALAVLMAANLLVPTVRSTHAADEGNLQKLIVALGSDDLAVRRDAAYDLAKIGPDAAPAVSALIDALKDRDEQIRFQSTMALARIGPAAAAAVPVLIELLTSRDDQHRYRAAYALGQIGTAALPALHDALESERASIRLGAARALGWMKEEARPEIPRLIELLDDPALMDRCVTSARQHFSLGDGAARYRTIYRSLIDEAA